MLPRQLQTLLARIYDAPVDFDISDFVITDARRLPAGALADEHLLVSQEGGTVKVSLYLASDVLKRLRLRDPMQLLDAANLADYWTVLEGVSHFQYLAWNAARDRPVSLHELEIQAEIDKYAATLFVLGEQHAGRMPVRLHHWLFDRTRIDARLEPQRRRLYESASRYAARFCKLLEERFLRRGRVRCEALLRELRAFYRLTHAPKIRHIEAARLEA
jgi:hypothetical protein